MRCDTCVRVRYLCRLLFQSTHLHEVRLKVVVKLMVGPLFQSTHLHEVRLSLWTTSLARMLFQSTHLHEVRQDQQIAQSKATVVSIHAPT